MVILTNIITCIAGLFIFQNEFDFAVLTYSFGLHEKTNFAFYLKYNVLYEQLNNHTHRFLRAQFGWYHLSKNMSENIRKHVLL